MTKVLVFESDAAFANQLKSELEARSCVVSVVDDASAGLQSAAADRPDLILLSVELPRMNGFSVCGKLKRDPNLNAVPLIIMSTDATEETFEQHRRLRTRAEDYVRKPIAFADLERHITALIDLGGGGAGAADATANAAVTGDEVLIDDEVDFVDTDIDLEDEPTSGIAESEEAVSVELSADIAGHLPDTQMASSSSVAQFAEHALGTLLDDAQADVAPPESQDGFAEASFGESPISTQRSSHDGASLQQQLAITHAELENARSKLSAFERVNGELEAATARIRELERSAPDASRVAELEAQLSQMSHRAEQAELRASDLEHKLKSGPRGEDVQRLQHDLEEARSKGGATARDFLELREQINRKDKEMIDLRDQLMSRDRELLNLRDASLAQERSQADLSDKVAELDKQLHELQRQNEALKADKEQAAKRAEDYKKRNERLSAESENYAAERKAERDRHEEELAVLRAQEAASYGELQQAMQALKVEHESALGAAVAAVKQQLAAELGETHNQALAAKQAEFEALRQEKDAALAQAEQDKEAALDALREEIESIKFAAVAARESELRQEHDSTLAALHRANESQLTQLKNDHQGALERLLDEHQSVRDKLAAEHQNALGQAEMAHQGALAALTDEHHAALQQNQAEHQNALAQVRSELQATIERLISEHQNALSQLRSERDTLTAERDSAISERDALTAQRDALMSERDAVAAERDSALSERDALRQQYDALRHNWDESKNALAQARDLLGRLSEISDKTL